VPKLLFTKEAADRRTFGTKQASLPATTERFYLLLSRFDCGD